MGTVFSIDVRAPGVLGADLDEIISWLHWVDDTFSTYQPTSDVSRLGRGEIALAECAPEVGEILQRCTALTAQTQGYFSAYATGVLDPSGLVKGWAIERASELLRAAGSVNHCVNGGGDVQCAGGGAPGEPWRIGIADPRSSGQLAAIFTGFDVAVATSGSAERGAHIIDPHTARSPTAVVSVSLKGEHLADVDSYATAAFAMGTAAPAWISSLAGISGLVLFADGTRWSSADGADGH
jgi:thiamine biosynthesis lipoprotein